MLCRARGAGWGRLRRGAGGSSSDLREGVGSPGLPSWEGRGFRETLAPAICPGGVIRRVFKGHAVLVGEGAWCPARPQCTGGHAVLVGRGPGAPPRPQSSGGGTGPPPLHPPGASPSQRCPWRLPGCPCTHPGPGCRRWGGPFFGHSIGEPTQGSLLSPRSSRTVEGVLTPLPPLTLLWAQTDPPPSPPPLLWSLPPSGDKCPAPPSSVPLFPELCHCSAQRPGRWAGSEPR